MNIFITNLSSRVKDQNLREIFEEYGNVSSAKVIKDQMTGTSRGFGFVEMPNDDEALKAIEELNEADWDGKTVKVSKARPKGAADNNKSKFNRY